MTGQGSSGNVIAALASFFIPGLGQLIQGRPFAAFFLLCWPPAALDNLSRLDSQPDRRP